MDEPIKSRRGYYYDLSKSPYEYESPYGDLFKFPSEKQLEIYRRDIEKELNRIDKALDKTGCRNVLRGSTIQTIYKAVYVGLYKRMRN